MSSKDIEKKFVGQPIFKQLIDFLPKNKFDILVQKHQSDRYYKSFSSWTQLVTILFGVFSRCDSMGEICDGMLAMQGKLNHLGLSTSPAKSTAGDGLRQRDNEFFKEFYFLLIKHFEPILSVSRIEKVSFEKLFIGSILIMRNHLYSFVLYYSQSDIYSLGYSTFFFIL